MVRVSMAARGVTVGIVADSIPFLSHPRSDIKDTPCLLGGLLADEMLMNEGLHGFLLPPDLKNTIALSLDAALRSECNL